MVVETIEGIWEEIQRRSPDLKGRLVRVQILEDSASTTHESPDSTASDWARRFQQWAESHDPSAPLLSDEAISRASIYGDR